MNYSRMYDGPKEAKIPGYESSVEKPIYMQGAQPVSINERDFSQHEIPIYYQEEEEVKATVGSCLAVLLLQLVPIVGQLMLFGWAFSKDNNYVRRILSRALLAFYAIAGSVAGLAFLAANLFR